VIGARLEVEWDRFDYVFGLLMDEGLVPGEQFMPAGATTLVVTEEGWATLDAEVQQEVARFLRPGSEIQVLQDDEKIEVHVAARPSEAGAGDNGVSGSTPEERADGGVAEASPAGGSDSGTAPSATGARSRARRPAVSETTKGAH
jgi:hypothetical protein